MEEKKEKYFLAEWESQHPKPKKITELPGWYKERGYALGQWRREQELLDLKERREQEQNFQKKYVMDQIYYKHIKGDPKDLPPFMQGMVPFDETQFVTTDFSDGMAFFTTMACLEGMEELLELAKRISPPKDSYENICKDMANRHKDEVITMRRLCQRGLCSDVADRMQSQIETVISEALTADRERENLARFLGNQMVECFCHPEETMNPELRRFKKTFEERDKNHVQQGLYAVKRMTELSALYECTMEKFRHRECRQEHFTEQELKDFLLGSYVASELKKCREQKKLTKEALRLGEYHVIRTAGKGERVIFGDEEIFAELKKSDTYRQLEKMTIGEIDDMRHQLKRQEKPLVQEKIPVREKKTPVLEKK